MKKLILLGLAVMVFAACQQEQRYFAESAETKTLEAGIAAYESGDWDTWKSHFADTAKIYVNSDKSVSVSQRTEDLKGAISNLSSYGFDKEKQYIEMVIDKDDENWVYYWSTWNGVTKNNRKISVPVHLAVRFIDGKIITEHVFFDGTAFNTDEVRYTQKSPEIEISKAVIKSYDKMDWATLTSHYADTAKVHFNTTEKNPMEASKIPEFHKANDANYSSRGFVEKDNFFEMVITDKGENWVNFWGTWKCKLKTNGKELEIPVHLTSQYIDGKIVKEFGYWDGSQLVLELQSK
jgi:ketosteroid isomerase-like protein